MGVDRGPTEHVLLELQSRIHLPEHFERGLGDLRTDPIAG